MRSSEGDGASPRTGRRRGARLLGSVLYWLAVLLVSLALVVGLVLVLESRDLSGVGLRGAPGSAASTARAFAGRIA